MTLNPQAAKSFSKEEPIPGYHTKERIGVGGYGEVWRAYAPGGLVKAIKFVFGSMDEQRAVRELRSLNRIKEVRHPFLLSVERIEVIEGNLVIVTELADGSLKQRFAQYRDKGASGIPREELVAHLRDAADALDYIYENYSLQHLDIKPENLLLVGNRIKVADFGLIKNLYERNASLIEGLTPIYAPPELFDGKPNRHSDQYSIAIVYQHMLTGSLPFDGTTAARLASQHLHSAPDLSALPKADQLVLARALSKDPEKRHADCRALVNALVEAGHSALRMGHSFGGALTGEPFQGISRATKDNRTGGEFHVDAGANPIQATAGTQKLTDIAIADITTAKPQERRAVRTPQLADGENAQAYVPTLFIGLGGTANCALRKLRQRFQSRLGKLDDLPALRFLSLDTVDAAASTTSDDPAGALNWRDCLAMPLKRPEHYRDDAPRLLGWLNRRWLYNIPRSLATEGLRPLGRLALIDHLDRFRTAARTQLEEMTTEASVARTREVSGLDFRLTSPRVFVVASISGGTGGGMVLDVAYVVRMLLGELNLSDDMVHGILMHSTPRISLARDKAVANAYATLSELSHYSRPGSHFPGDRHSGLTAFHGNNRAFTSCYYIPLGDDLTEEQWQAATDPVAEYLHCSTVTPAAQFLESGRQVEAAEMIGASKEFTLRSFGLAQLGGSNTDIPLRISKMLCEELVQRWRTGGRPPIDLSRPQLHHVPTALIAARKQREKTPFQLVDRMASEEARALCLATEALEVEARDILVQEMGADGDKYFSRLISQAMAAESTAGEPQEQHVGPVLDVLDAILGRETSSAPDETEDSAFDSLQAILSTRFQGRAARMGSAIREWLFNLVEQSNVRVDGATHAAEWFQRYLRQLQLAVESRLCELRDKIAALRDSLIHEFCEGLPSPTGKPPTRHSQKKGRDAQPLLMDYARLRLERIGLAGVVGYLRTVEVQITATQDRLREFLSDLNRLADDFHGANVAHEFGGQNSATPLDGHRRAMFDSLLEQKDQLLVTLEKLVTEFLTASRRRLPQLLAQHSDVRRELKAPLQAASRALVVRTMQDANLARIAVQSKSGLTLGASDVQQCLQAATPAAHSSSSLSQLILIAPQLADTTAIEQQVCETAGQPPITIRTPDGDLVVCYEVDQISLPEVANRLIEQRTGYIEAASRLHTRTDVKWQPIAVEHEMANR